jgi:hypothetical protein
VKVNGGAAENMAVTTHPKPAKKTPKAASPAKPTTVAASPPTPRRNKPMIALARRRDSSVLSFSERLAELRHTQFKHTGPVCHSCRMSASELARASAPTAIAG